MKGKPLTQKQIDRIIAKGVKEIVNAIRQVPETYARKAVALAKASIPKSPRGRKSRDNNPFKQYTEPQICDAIERFELIRNGTSKINGSYATPSDLRFCKGKEITMIDYAGVIAEADKEKWFVVYTIQMGQDCEKQYTTEINCFLPFSVLEKLLPKRVK